MKDTKYAAFILSMALAAGIFSGCGSGVLSDSHLSEITTFNASSESDIPPQEKRIELEGYGLQLLLDSDWTAEKGTEADDPAYALVTSYPAVFHHRSPRNSCCIKVTEGCKTEEEFASQTAEDYIKETGLALTIHVTDFEFLEIDGLDSLKVTSQMCGNGITLEEVHIISNCPEKNLTFSILLTQGGDCDRVKGLFDDFEERIQYDPSLSCDEKSKSEESQ
ncbi:MAG: hypothetical protein IJ496_09920 [Ruminococcus sp.]|nr:hypothetical protein [Ruminococcus sp.]